MTTGSDAPADQWLKPLFAALGRRDLDRAGALLADAQRHIPHHPHVRAVALDLPLMRASGLAARSGPVAGDEGEILDQAYDAALETLARPDAQQASRFAAMVILLMLGGGRNLDALGDFRSLGRAWASAGLQGLVHQLPRVVTPEDRREVLEQHRIAARPLEAAADRAPILRHAPASVETGRIRVGFLSADLHGHAVASFALPLFEHVDPAAVELFCYSTRAGPPDPVERFIRGRSTFREIAHLDDRAAAQAVADDRLDVLIEMGGPTGANRLGIMAFRPAPSQVSWMGYPHSTGLSAIDHIVVDPYLRPASDDLLAEAPLVMPASWICLARVMFSQAAAPDPVPPCVRTGSVTFGSANQAYKYAGAIATWAAVMRAVPGSSFLFVRPECASARLRANLAEAFARHGIGADRLRFAAVREGYMGRYDEIDINLDTFPLTGGTTTCEALWMGTPVVTLVGEAMFERLGHSILTNAGLGRLCAGDRDEFVRIAVDLAADVDQLRELRASLRSRIAASPLGDGRTFARDFFGLITGLAMTRRTAGA